ncbi:MAG: hypothetical protein WDA27_04720 [Actinomycetota bacterium]
MEDIGVVVAHDDPAVCEQIAEVLEAARGLFVTATSADAETGHVLVAGGERLVMLRSPRLPLVALADGEPLRAARAALALGARDIVCWPQEAARLPGAVVRAASGGVRRAASGWVCAVGGARGGVGATMLAAALARAWAPAVIVDLAPGAGQRTFATTDPVRTLHDLVGLDDCAPESVEGALEPHVAGVRALHARASADLPPVAAVHGLVRACRETSPVTVLDCGGVTSESARAAAAAADARVVVLANDVASVRGARALAERLPSPVFFVLRRERRSGIATRDVAAALGAEMLGVVPQDGGVARAADLGALPPARARASRTITTLARALRTDHA